jgi:NADH-quinone oxidoreductase subunit H
MAETLFILLIFPGIAFQLISSWLFEWLDRKLQALFQRRVGPRWFQPLADMLKLFSKEDILPLGTNEFAAAVLPLTSIAAVLTAGIYVPIAGFSPASFEGDLIVILFLLSFPTFTYYLAGIISMGVYNDLGAGRALLQFFSYEVPLLIALSGPAVMAGSWMIQEISSSQMRFGPFALFQPLGFILAVVGLIGKLKRNPLDIPKAKSEVVAGALTEFTGLKLALWNLVMDIQAVVGIFLLVNLYFGRSFFTVPFLNILVFILQSILIVIILSTASAVFVRLRIDQLAGLGWKVLVPLALLQFLVVIFMGV